MKKITEPDWNWVTMHDFQQWFHEYIEGRFIIEPSDLVEVYGLRDAENEWNFIGKQQIADTHKAYLIKSSITEIKEDSVEDIIRDLAEGNYPAVKGAECESMLNWFAERARNARS